MLDVHDETRNKELECIRLALNARISEALQKLLDLQNYGRPFDHWIFEYELKLGGNPIENLSKIIVMIVILLLSPFIVLSIPFSYVAHRRRIHRMKLELMEEIRILESRPANEIFPKEKTLYALWRLHGFHGDDWLDLLAEWIKILYGEDGVSSSELESRVQAIADQQFQANQPFYNREPDGIHFNFVPPGESLLRELSKELSFYG